MCKAGVFGYATLCNNLKRWSDLISIVSMIHVLHGREFEISKSVLNRQQAGDVFLDQYENEEGHFHDELLDLAAECYTAACDDLERALISFFRDHLGASLEQINFPIHGDLLEERRTVGGYLKEMEVIIKRAEVREALGLRLREAARLAGRINQAIKPLIDAHRRCSCTSGYDSRRRRPSASMVA